MRETSMRTWILLGAATLLLGACTKKPAEPAPAPTVTAAEADAFIQGVNDDYRVKIPYFSAAQWAQQTYITDDTQLLSSRANDEFLEYVGRKLDEAKRFNGLELSPATTRGMLLLKLSTANPAPRDAAERAELTRVLAKMDANYGAAKWCRGQDDCLSLGEIEKIIDDPAQTPEARAAAWAGWHQTARPIKADYETFVRLGNAGARELGFANLGEMWRAGYDMSPVEFEATVEKLWTQLQPLYEALHCQVRAKLNAQYGDAVVPKDGLIPAHLLGNMWAQQWSNIYPLVEPYPASGKSSTNEVSAALKKKRNAIYAQLFGELKSQPTTLELAELSHKADAQFAIETTKIAEDFYTSIGMPPLPASFYDKSMLVKPRDRDVVCHASAWDMNMQGDVRIKMCIEPKEDDLTTIHHELGHIYYDLMYNPLPPLFQAAAHDGFHEAIGDTITLSLTAEHLHKIGLAPAPKQDPQALINEQMKLALDKITFLPWGKLVDQWRWKVFAGDITPAQYNDGWWQLRQRYQGVSSPLPRGAEDFDPGAKYHIPGNTPYTRYFLAFVLQFQFQKALCKAAGFEGPLYACDIYGNKEAGKKYMQMLQAGASQPWQDTLEKLTGTREMDASALIEYFAPLMGYLKEKNAGLSCGWPGEKQEAAG